MTVVLDFSTDFAGSDDGNGNSNINLRQVFTPTYLTAASGNQCQLKFRFGHTAHTAEGTAVDAVWFGQSTTAPNFNGDQVQVKFSGPIHSATTVALTH